MKMILTSPGAVAPGGTVNAASVNALKSITAAGHAVALISNHAQPGWFSASFAGSTVAFHKIVGRQSGAFIPTVVKGAGGVAYDALVLAASDDDVRMGKNGGAVLIAAGWAAAPNVAKLGIIAPTPQDFVDTVALLSGWTGQWWFTGANPRYQVRALCDLSSMHKGVTQQVFSASVTSTVKGGGPKLNALLALTARSLLVDGIDKGGDLLWGVYPSSKSANNDTDTLCDFTHRLRTTVSRVRYAERGEPLFIRHTISTKRSAAGGSVNRTDPTEQIVTINLNPVYKGRIAGRHVVVVDDCTTHGVSFGVAAAFLRAAGAKVVTGVALGKFGNQVHDYDITITSDPFVPVAKGGFTSKASLPFLAGTTSLVNQAVLLKLLP